MKTIEELAEIAYNAALIERYRRGDGHGPKWEDYPKKERWLSATLAVALTVDENYECKLAFAAGKRIEFRVKRNLPSIWEYCDNPNWYPALEYRVAPEWKLPQPPEGMKWHRDDWTQDELPEGFRPLLLREMEQFGDSELIDGVWHPVASPLMKAIPGMYKTRTTRPLPNPPKLKIKLPPLKLETGRNSFASN